MLLSDLIMCNKDFHGDTALTVISKLSNDPVTVEARFAVHVFGDRQVYWFQGCVVMLL